MQLFYGRLVPLALELAAASSLRCIHLLSKKGR